MITKLPNKNFIKKVKQGVCHKIILVFLVLPFSVFGQSIIWQEKPIDMQVFARDSLDKGYVVFKGDVDKTGGNLDYTSISIEAKRNGSPYGGTFTQTLIYTGELAPFDFSIEIDAERINYSFIVTLHIGTTSIVAYEVAKIVAGDVFIIQGQSNAEARDRSGEPTNSFNQDEFIRVYAGGVQYQVTLEKVYNNWYVANGDVGIGNRGNAGQWGLKLANLIMNQTNKPVAIFNGARPGAWIDYFQKNFTGDPEPTNNYERLLYRLDTTRLKGAVKAIFWSQGESVDGVNSVNDYKNSFLALRSSWLTDYPNIKKFYIFQTINGCNSDPIQLQYIKEAQRQLAQENTDIHLMTTDGLVQMFDGGGIDYCHFVYTNGYEGFANRLFELVKRDFYGGANYADIEPPNILDAYLTDDVKLVIKTDAATLNLNGVSASGHFFGLDNAGSATITDIQVSGSNIVFTLSEFPGNTASISNLGAIPGFQDLLITNSNFLDDLELVSFDKFPIDASRFTMWNSSAWSNNPPDSTKYAIVKGAYNASNGNIEAKDLTIDSGFNLNFDGGTTNSVIVHGDLTTNGTFIIGDQESLVITNANAIITGDVTKIENSSFRNSAYDFTYWSSPITNANIGTVFAGVTASRIFEFDPSIQVSDPNDPNYYAPWVVASGLMTPGRGYAAEGLTGIPGVHNISFTGVPNNGLITFNILENAGADPENDYNLIGNPYPSAIDIEIFLTVNNALVDPVVYLWTHNTAISTSGDFVSSDYATYNFSGGTGVGTNSDGTIIPDKNVGSSQGFFIRAINSGMVAFNNSMKMVDANDQFFKSNNSKNKVNDIEKDRIWLKLTTDQGGFNQLLIAFTDKATDGIDSGYDASRLDGGNPINFYSQIDSEKYVIQGLNTFSNDKSVILGFDINVAPRILTITIDKTQGALKDAEVYLIDHVLNVTHDLKNADYQFEQNIIGENLNRFTLQFSATAVLDVEDIILKNEFVVTNANESLKIRADQKVSSIQVFDMLGRILINEKPGKKSFYLKTESIKKGTVLLIRAKLENGSMRNKKTIKY